MQWNINGIPVKLPEIRQLIALYQPSLVCFQETRLKLEHSLKSKN